MPTPKVNSWQQDGWWLLTYNHYSFQSWSSRSTRTVRTGQQHPHTSYSDTSGKPWVIRARLRLQPEELSEEDPRERLAEVHKDGNVEDSVGIEIHVVDTIVLHYPPEEVARG
jgi:hypothetical protein